MKKNNAIINAILTATTKKEAWYIVGKLFPAAYILVPDSEQRAGYPIYRDANEYYNYVCDLGCRLEVNIGGKSKNIWIEKTVA